MVPVEPQRFMEQPRCEMGRKRKGQPQQRGELGAEGARSQEPHRNLRAHPRDRSHLLAILRIAQIMDQLLDVPGKIVRGRRLPAEGPRGRPVRSRSAAHPQINASRIEGFQRAELLGNDQW